MWVSCSVSFTNVHTQETWRTGDQLLVNQLRIRIQLVRWTRRGKMKSSALKREHQALRNMKFLHFFYFCGSFLPSWIRIWIHWPDWIRIQSGSGSGSETLLTRPQLRTAVGDTWQSPCPPPPPLIEHWPWSSRRHPRVRCWRSRWAPWRAPHAWQIHPAIYN